ncbi:MAG: alginate lyase family protein [Edaphobacter sp.]|uniref:alginate lyase family protein n=1 Tax=Edaphobacter sp. TaxID=1934404 RepID=UPI0023A0908F|nr:alginate lyase family protein [Edaphobacter sp.]MDE1175509.1 alginate lyase family protein [Edaphobacter sp.]
MSSTRRDFCSGALTMLLHSSSFAQTRAAAPEGSTARPNVAAIDRDRILAQAERALALPVMPITAIAADRSPGPVHDYYSEPTDQADPFLAHRDALFTLGHTVPALAAAYLITHEERYAKLAAAQMQAWFVTRETAMTPTLEFAQVATSAKTGRMEGVLEGLPLIEIAQSLPFLATSESFTEELTGGVTRWFMQYLDWLNSARSAGLARDAHDHNGSSWMLQAAACARLNLKDDSALTTLRHQFRSTTIRAQIAYDGNFSRELSTPNPYRNSLFNLDLLCGACELLSTRFEKVWDYELQDGPGMRVAIARYFPFIANRNAWPYRADAAFFTQLPLRRPALLLAARAYSRPEYADVWRTLPADTSNPELDRSFPIRQPLLWVTRPRP